MGGGRLAEIRRLASQRGDLRLAQLFAAFEQAVPLGASVPIELIDGPGDNGGLGEGSNLLCLVALDLLGERVARGRELGQRPLVEGGDVGEGGHDGR
jgi:hypothetical protein